MSSIADRAKIIGEILIKYKVIENLFGGITLLSFLSSNIEIEQKACRLKFKDYEDPCIGSHSITSVFNTKQKIARGDIDALERVLEAFDRSK